MEDREVGLHLEAKHAARRAVWLAQDGKRKEFAKELAIEEGRQQLFRIDIRDGYRWKCGRRCVENLPNVWDGEVECDLGPNRGAKLPYRGDGSCEAIESFQHREGSGSTRSGV